MKELNTFRQFISEEKDKKVSEDKIEAAIKATLKKEGGAAGIDPLKKAVKDLDVDTDFDIEKFLKKMSNVEKHKNGDYILTPLKENDEVLDEILDETAFDGFGDYRSKEEKEKQALLDDPIEEGTWDLGSVAEMVKVLGKLNQIRRMGAARGSVELENMDNVLYRVFGDDEFHDAIDSAKGTDDDDRFNNFMGDAQDRAKELYIDELKDAKERGETGMEFKPRFGLEEEEDFETALPGEKGYDSTKLALSQAGIPEGIGENDTVLDEIIGEKKEEVKEGLFDEIDMMMDKLAVHMSAEETLRDLMGEFEAISGGPKVLHMALKNLMMGAGLMEESLEEGKESLTKQIMKKYPKKYKDEQAVKDAAKELMKNPKFKVKGGIGPVLQALLKGK
jgi:hypothetical protein